MTKPTTYIVTLLTPYGTGQMEVPTFQCPAAAARRAVFVAAALGWGDLDEIKVVSVTVEDQEDEK